MKIALITGTAYRHTYYAATVALHGDVVLHVRVARSQELIDEVSDSEFSDSDRTLLKEHSALRSAKEKEYFLPLAANMPRVPVTLEVSMQELNTQPVIDALKSSGADLVLVYGVELLKPPLLAVAPELVINLHAGLSPYFRGVATLYWPVYFMKPQEIGFTFHRIDNKIDHGDILHQNRPEIKSEDTIHDLGCRTVILAASDMTKLLPRIERGGLQFHKPASEGKIFYARDFKPYHLRVTDRLMRDGLFAEYLENPELFPVPKYIQQI